MISRESREYLRELRKHPAFGVVGNEFNLDGLRQGMTVLERKAARAPLLPVNHGLKEKLPGGGDLIQ